MTPRSTRTPARTRVAFPIDAWLTAWSVGDVEKLIAYYTPDCSYVDPATRGELRGHDALRIHLGKVFHRWPEQEWRRLHAWHHAGGFTLEWEATIASPKTGNEVTFSGLDLIELTGDKIAVQKIYFDPAPWRALL